MTANHKPFRNKRISGSILLEINIVFIVLVLVCSVYCNAVQTVLKNSKKLLADIEILQAARFTESILRRELSYNSAQVRLVKGFNNKDQINCQKTFKNVFAYWYPVIAAVLIGACLLWQKPSGWPFVCMFTYFIAGVINAIYCMMFIKEG